MTDTPREDKAYGVRIAQMISIAAIWGFVLGISAWILNLLALSVELQDSLGATVAISLVAIPVFLTLASILTYVFVGLKREERRLQEESTDPY